MPRPQCANKYSLYIFLLILVASNTCVFHTVSSFGIFETKICAFFFSSAMRAVRPAHRFVFRSVDVNGTIYPEQLAAVSAANRLW